MSEHTEVLPEPLPAEPLTVAQAWLAQAWNARNQPNPNAMVLATTTSDGRPSARVVLCKDIQPMPGFITFYTNYESRKGRELAANGRAAVVMHWDHMHRQVRIEGAVVKAPEADSDTYFASRALASRIGAWASKQSEPVASRAELLSAVDAAATRLGVSNERTAGQDARVPRPPHWGGFRLWADAVELWVEGDARIHDRARWTRTLTARADGQFDTGPWNATRLQP
jgi:pyridoxamine 5'-phosphate oxidase